MNTRVWQLRAWLGTDRVTEKPRVGPVVPTHVPSARPARWTAHCHAATAHVLTRAYQGDHRRQRLLPSTPVAATRRTRAPRLTPLTTPFHIRAYAALDTAPSTSHLR